MLFTFGTFTEHADSAFRHYGFPSLRQSHLFWLGEDDDFCQSVNALRDDLVEEMKERVPMPFDDVSTVSIVRRMMPGDPPNTPPAWTLDRVIENRELVERFTGRAFQMSDIGQRLLILRYQYGEEWAAQVKASSTKFLPITPWSVRYLGVQNPTGKKEDSVCAFSMGLPDGFREACEANNVNIMDVLGHDTKNLIDQITAISHPGNYIVQVQPRLTAHEERRQAYGKMVPLQKLPHYIVIDHEALTQMRSPSTGTHASPAPHERRGHWRRLAERCRIAKSLGRDKAWVRPALIGEPRFEDQKNRYIVRFDLMGK